MTDASARAREILDAIERDADRRRRAMTTTLPPPADVPAPAFVRPPPTHETARLLALVDHVVEQTRHAQERLEALDAAVTTLSRRLGVEAEVDGTRAAAVPVARSSPPVAPSALNRRSPESTRSDGVRLVAIEMAVGGFSRGEVHERLAREYGLAAPDGMLDDVFGAGSTDASRMPWGAV